MSTVPLKPSPLEIISQDVLGLLIDPYLDPDRQFGPGSLSVDRQVWSDQDNPGIWMINLQIHLTGTEDERPPSYAGHIKVVGRYRVHPEYRHDPEKLIRITGASMLFGVAREMIAHVTARSINGMLTLPSVSFFEEPEKKKPSPRASLKRKRDKPESKA
ncbi:MAG: hypothetical protein ACFE0O_14225 [Opitutales bacterium]